MKKILSFASFVFLVSAPIIVQGAEFTYNPNLVRAAQSPVTSQGQVAINWDNFGDFTVPNTK